MNNIDELANFIQSLRKEKGLTQKDVAEKLNVSVQAVSKWETGKSCPDIFLFKPLSELLGITVVELLNAKKIEDVNIKKESDNVIINTFNKTNEKIKKLLLLSFIFICFISLLFLLISSFQINANKLGDLIEYSYKDENFYVDNLYLLISNDYKNQKYTHGSLLILNEDLIDSLNNIEIFFCYNEECYNLYLNGKNEFESEIYFDDNNLIGLFDENGKRFKSLKLFEDRMYSVNLKVKLYYTNTIKEYKLDLKPKYLQHNHSKIYSI